MPDALFPYHITAESAADLTDGQLAALAVRALPLEYRIGAGDVAADGLPEEGAKDVLLAMQRAEPVSVAMAGAARYKAMWTPELKRGQDVLHLSLSSALSQMYAAATLAARECARAFPARQVAVIDTLAASGGIALLLWRASQYRADGMPFAQCRARLEEEKRSVQHMVAVPDLMPLLRCGLLQREPVDAPVESRYAVLSLDASGRIYRRGAVSSSAASLRIIADCYFRTLREDGAAALILHTGAHFAAKRLSGMLRTGETALEIRVPGAATCACLGPGAVGLFFFGSGRR